MNSEPPSWPSGLERELQRRAGEIVDVEIPWEHAAWTATWRVVVDRGRTVYLKRSPRSRREVSITKRVHAIAPDIVPAVIADDLAPGDSMHWFLLGDAGAFSHGPADARRACETTEALARIQRLAAKDDVLRRMLPQCPGRGLLGVLRDHHEWSRSLLQADAEVGRLEHAWATIERNAATIDLLTTPLQMLPDTLVHGDLWPGNMGRDAVVVLDWADAMWGPGGIDVAHLILRDGEALKPYESDLWAAYGRGWEVQIPVGYASAAEFARGVGGLVCLHEIASAMRCLTASNVGWLLAGYEHLASVAGGAAQSLG